MDKSCEDASTLLPFCWERYQGWIFIVVNFCIAAIYLAVLRHLLVEDTKKDSAKKANSMKKERKFGVNFQRGSKLNVQAAPDLEDPSSHKSSTSSNV